jgi:lipopolysaccharide transport system permease protein
MWRDIKVRYKQTIFGALWAILQPFVTMVVFSVVFGRLVNVPSEGIPYPIFLYSALVPWVYFSGALTFAGNSLVGNANLITKVYFPRVAIPTSSVLGGLLDFGIASLLLIGMMAYYNIQPGWALLLWPFLVILLVLLALGVGMILASLNVKYRDIKYALPFGIQLWLFITPIIYPTSVVPERFRGLMALNPLTGIIEGFRSAILPMRPINWPLLLMSVGLTILLFFLGMIYFSKTERTFADVV